MGYGLQGTLTQILPNNPNLQHRHQPNKNPKTNKPPQIPLQPKLHKLQPQPNRRRLNRHHLHHPQKPNKKLPILIKSFNINTK